MDAGKDNDITILKSERFRPINSLANFIGTHCCACI
jgi:hypothetical protein